MNQSIEILSHDRIAGRFDNFRQSEALFFEPKAFGYIACNGIDHTFVFYRSSGPFERKVMAIFVSVTIDELNGRLAPR